MYCTICQKTLKQNIKVHLDEHRQVTMFRCSSCDKRYKYRSSLNQHERIWHGKDLNGLAKIALKRSVEKVILQGTVPYIVKKKKIEKLNCLSV